MLEFIGNGTCDTFNYTHLQKLFKVTSSCFDESPEPAFHALPYSLEKSWSVSDLMKSILDTLPQNIDIAYWCSIHPRGQNPLDLNLANGHVMQWIPLDQSVCSETGYRGTGELSE